jgi:hypothetical protein
MEEVLTKIINYKRGGEDGLITITFSGNALTEGEARIIGLILTHEIMKVVPQVEGE